MFLVKTLDILLNSNYCISIFDTLNPKNDNYASNKSKTRDLFILNMNSNKTGFEVIICDTNSKVKLDFDTCKLKILDLKLLTMDTFIHKYDQKNYSLKKYQFSFSFRNNTIKDSFILYTSADAQSLL